MDSKEEKKEIIEEEKKDEIKAKVELKRQEYKEELEKYKEELKKMTSKELEQEELDYRVALDEGYDAFPPCATCRSISCWDCSKKYPTRDYVERNEDRTRFGKGRENVDEDGNVYEDEDEDEDEDEECEECFGHPSRQCSRCLKEAGYKAYVTLYLASVNRKHDAIQKEKQRRHHEYLNAGVDELFERAKQRKKANRKPKLKKMKLVRHNYESPSEPELDYDDYEEKEKKPNNDLWLAIISDVMKRETGRGELHKLCDRRAKEKDRTDLAFDEKGDEEFIYYKGKHVDLRYYLTREELIEVRRRALDAIVPLEEVLNDSEADEDPPVTTEEMEQFENELRLKRREKKREEKAKESEKKQKKRERAKKKRQETKKAKEKEVPEKKRKVEPTPPPPPSVPTPTLPSSNEIRISIPTNSNAKVTFKINTKAFSAE